jgi:hypothetical protein
VFSECSPDILDEIRSAVLDDTQISSFINPCGNDNYKLGQLRMAVRELIPVEFLNTKVTGRTIYNVRQGFAKNRDMSDILLYYNKLDAETLEKISEFLYLGTDITGMDFNIVPKHLVDITLSGLYKGYPMWLIIEDNCNLTVDKVKLLMNGLSLGVDIHPFLSSDWSDSCILLLLSYSKSVDINELLSLITGKFDEDCINELVVLYKSGIDIRRLCIKDTDGYPVYNSYQIHEIGLAIKEGFITEEMYNPVLSDMDILELKNKEKEKDNRVLSVSLKN